MESPEKSVAKRKRTKRLRPVPVPASGSGAAAAASSASSSSAEFSGCTTEEDDMAANCLILLAQGRRDSPGAAEWTGKPGADQNERFNSRRFAEAAATAEGGRAGFYVYECKTCGKCFPSFQALGGHRASHKKPKIAEEKKAIAAAAAAAEDERLPHLNAPIYYSPRENPCVRNHGGTSSSSNNVDDDDDNNNNGSSNGGGGNNNNNNNNGGGGSGNNANNNTTNNNKAARVHECAICGAEFGSGQALGGHMRRHRPLNAPAEAAESKKERAAILSLDLNLPAPSDDVVGGRLAEFAQSPPPPPPPPFPFEGKHQHQHQQQHQHQHQQQQQQLIFSASALVDCHY